MRFFKSKIPMGNFCEELVFFVFVYKVGLSIVFRLSQLNKKGLFINTYSC